MTVTVLLTTLAALAVAFYIAAPFLRESALRAPAGAPTRERKRALEMKREALLREIKELEFDRRMGKVDPDEYASARGRLTQEAAQVLTQLEEAARASSRAEKPARARVALEIEAEVAVARARRRMKRTERAKPATAWQCECGRVMPTSDRFCGSCGQPRAEEAAQAVA